MQFCVWLFVHIHYSSDLNFSVSPFCLKSWWDDTIDFQLVEFLTNVAIPSTSTSAISHRPVQLADYLGLLIAERTRERERELSNAQPGHASPTQLKLRMAKTTSTAYHLNNHGIHCHLNVFVKSVAMSNSDHPVYLSMMLDCELTYRPHIESLKY